MSKTVEKKDVAVVEKERGLTGQGSAMVGIQGIEAEDIIWPKVLLMQGLSKFVQEDGRRAGEFVNSLSKKVITDTTFVPVSITKYYEGYTIKGDKQEFEFRTMDKHDERLVGRRFFNDRETKQKANAGSILSCVGLFGGKPMMVTFAKTSYRAGKTLVSIIQSEGRPLYELKFKLATRKETNDAGTFYVLDVEHLGDSTEQERNAGRAFQETFLPHVDKVINAKAQDDEQVPF